jgi:hypothetical protein
MGAPMTTKLKLVDSPDRTTQAVFETAHEQTRLPGNYVITVEQNAPDGEPCAHECASCGEPLVAGPVEGRIDSGVVIQCPVCRAYNKVTD